MFVFESKLNEKMIAVNIASFSSAVALNVLILTELVSDLCSKSKINAFKIQCVLESNDFKTLHIRLLVSKVSF